MKTKRLPNGRFIGGEIGESGKAAVAALGKFPDMPTHALARMLFAQHPHLFTNLELARKSIQYYRGALGAKHREVLKRGATSGKYLSTASDRIRAAMPDGSVEFVWREITITQKRTLVLADILARWHDHAALSVALAYGVEQHCDCVLFLGDFLDFYELSKFDRRRDADALKATLQAGWEILKLTRAEFPTARIIWKLGNHDERWSAYIHRKGPELFALKVDSLAWVMEHPSLWGGDDKDAAELRLEVIEDPVPLKIGALYLWHGHEYARGTASSPVNAARNALMKTLECALVGHQHQSSSHSETSASGRLFGAWSSGCLCNLHPRYAPMNRFWTHGFAVVEYNGGKNFTVHNKRIIQGKVY